MPRLSAFFSGFVLAIAIAGSGCAAAPVQEMSDARQAVRAAVDAGAAEYAPDELKAAEEYLRRAQESLKIWNFGQARMNALGAKDRAQGALRITRRTKNEVDHN